jgi:hypothetical protein
VNTIRRRVLPALTVGILILISQFCFANMSSPIWKGTNAGTAFSSRDIDILHEKIHLKIEEDFKIARYEINYVIRTDSAGKQIPLLFYAMDYKDEFIIWVDDQQVKLLTIPIDSTTSLDHFSKFSNIFSHPNGEAFSQTVELSWGNEQNNYFLKDLKYFEVDLSKGEHRIRIDILPNPG